jgi:hypothetical protein
VNSYGSWVRLNFGRPSLDVREPVPNSDHLRSRRVTVEGEYQLFVELADWTLDIPGSPSATSESSQSDIAKSLAALEGQILRAAKISSTPPTSVFRFDLGATLSLSSYQDAEPDMELWHLFHGHAEISLLASGELLLSSHETNAETRSAFRQFEFAV